MRRRAATALSQADELERQGNRLGAIRVLERATQANMSSPAALLRLAHLYRQEQRILLAIVTAERAVSSDPANVSAHEALIALSLEARDHQKAVDACHHLLDRMPTHIPARDALGNAYLAMGQVDAALRVAGDLVRLDPGEPTHRFKKAMLNQHHGNVVGAVDDFMRVVEMAPESDLAQSAWDQLEALDEHQIGQIIVLAQEDVVFRQKLFMNPDAAVHERGYSLSDQGVDRLVGVLHFAFEDEEPAGRLRLYH